MVDGLGELEVAEVARALVVVARARETFGVAVGRALARVAQAADLGSARLARLRIQDAAVGH